MRHLLSFHPHHKVKYLLYQGKSGQVDKCIAHSNLTDGMKLFFW